MAIETNCPACGTRLRVGDEHAGQEARCPACKMVFAVPGGGPATPGPPAEDQDGWQLKTPEGQVYGPVPRTDFDRWLAEGRIAADCQVRSGADGPWRLAEEVYPVLRPRPLGPPVVSAASSRSDQAGGARGRAESPPPAEGRVPEANAVGPDRRRSDAGRTASGFATPHRGGLVLALGIVGWLVSCPVFAVLAWMLGSSDLREMREGRMDAGGHGLTQAGQMLGMIYTLLWLAALVIGLFVLLLVAAVSVLG